MKNTREVAEANRLALLDAATEEFYEKGYNTARLTDIAERVGMTKGAIYGHFKSKTGLCAAIFSERTRGTHQQGLLDVYYSGGGVYETLDRLIDAMYDDDYEILLGAHKRATTFQKLAAEESPEIKEILSAVDASWELVFENHCQLLERGQEEGVVRADIDPYTTTRMFYAMTWGHLLRFRDWFDHDPKAKALREVTRTLLVDTLRPPR